MYRSTNHHASRLRTPQKNLELLTYFCFHVFIMHAPTHPRATTPPTTPTNVAAWHCRVRSAWPVLCGQLSRRKHKQRRVENEALPCYIEPQNACGFYRTTSSVVPSGIAVLLRRFVLQSGDETDTADDRASANSDNTNATRGTITPFIY